MAMLLTVHVERPAYYNASPMTLARRPGAWIPGTAAGIAFTGGLLVLMGWAFGIQFLTQPVSVGTTMRPATAGALVAIGVALWLYAARPRLAGVAAIIGGLVAALGIVSLAHLVVGPEFRFDRLWLASSDPVSRMSPLTAIDLLVLGIALAVSVRPAAAWLAQSLALFAMLVATIVAIGYLFRISNLIGVGGYTTMAPHTDLILLIVCIGILFLHADRGIMAVYTSDSLGGQMARRILPATIVIPIGLGWLRLEGERAGWYDPRVGPPFLIIGTMILLSIVVWVNARMIAKVDARRQDFEEELRRSNETLEVRVAEKTAALAESHERIRTGQRMEALGQLAGGVAHDFNNMMTVVTGYSELLLARAGDDHPFRKPLLEIKKAGDRCASLTGHLLAFSRRQVLTPAVIDLGSIVTDLSQMMPMLLGEAIAVTVSVQPVLWCVRADQAQLEQVIVNLVVNARDAMPAGGTLRISVGDRVIDQSAAAAYPEIVPGDYVHLSVADSGHGMDESTRARVFDPFFTTKPVGQGSGLGLSTAYGFIKQSGGYIYMESELQRGTTVHVFLPRAEAASTSTTSPGAGIVPGGHETVLLTEDDSLVRSLLSDVLGQAGYDLLEAPDGPSALALAAQHRGPIQLLISDIVMPGMSGTELADLLTATRPETHVLWISGYAQSAIVEQTSARAGASLLMKPFTGDQILSRIREILDTPNNTAATG